MGVRKATNRKIDFQGHSKALSIMLFDRPHMICY